MIGDPKWSENVVQVSERWQWSVWYMRNVSGNKDNKRCHEIWGQYTIGWSKGELSVLFGSGGNKKHKYSCNNRMKHETLVKCKANQPEIIPEKPKLWCSNHVKKVWWNTPEKATQLGRVLKSVKYKNVTNGPKVSKKVRKGCRSEREHCRVS